MSKRYWKSPTERGDNGARRRVDAEFPGTPRPDRRGFLRAAGFTFAGAWLAGCRQAPVTKAIPQLAQPEGFTPGRSYYYASTCAGCAAGCGVLVKTRDGRPIKLEGNPEHPVSRGGLCAVGQASILGLYDSHRFRQPLSGGKQTTWEAVDRELGARLEALRREGGVRFLTGTVISPTIRSAIAAFLGRFRDGRHVEYDALSCSAILDAHERTHGVRVIPRYRFDRAEVIASFDADFLGTWISPVEFTAGYMAGRNPEAGRFSWHAQIEPRLSLTGSKADRRLVRKPGDVAALLFELAAQIETGPAGGDAGALAERLLQARGRSLVVCGIQDVAAQLACNRINDLLGNYGETLDLERPSLQRRGSDTDTEALLREAAAGKVAALFVWGANPLYEMPGGEGLRRVPLIVTFAERMDETAAAAHFICPDRHALESWGDAEPVSGTLSLFQPAIQPFGGSRQLVESLAAWSGSPKSAYQILRDSWRERVFPRQTAEADFEKFWERAVHDGYVVVEPARTAVQSRTVPLQPPPRQAASPGQFDLVLYAKPGMPDGRHAYNPWLQELPDPITKVTWDNYASLAPAAAGRLGVAQGDEIRLDVHGKQLSLPVVVQPGQHEEVVAVALGYGSKCSERFANLPRWWIGGRSSAGDSGLVGRNAAPMLEFASGVLRYTLSGVTVGRTGRKHPIASTQDHHSLSVPKHLAPASGRLRPIVREVALADLGKLPPPSRGPELELWPPDHVYPGRRWAMVVDLNACTGCSACVVACQVENNIPVVGKDEVGRNREMHWMRIDRYYSEAGGSIEVAHQPMMCQQCEHAPCETVCPVLATVHSEEGLNQQVYNRCVGTRYCANNCPYKARRFNWFEYAREDKLANLVLNPDVTVRSRGVMEKCTFCVQRIQEAKIEAKRRGERLRDGEIQTACQQSCPAKAITFGDWNDPKSRVSLLMRAKRRYWVLEEINVRPSVGYLRVVRNRPTGDKEGERHG